MVETVKIEGLDGVLARMAALPPALVSKRGGVVRAALRKGAMVIVKDARRRAPVSTGALKKNIASAIDPVPKKSGANEGVRVGVRGGAKKYANTKYNARKGRAGKSYKTGGSTYYWRFLEFGTKFIKPQPFLRPAFESQKRRALDVITKELHFGIEKAVAKMEGKKPPRRKAL